MQGCSSRINYSVSLDGLCLVGSPCHGNVLLGEAASERGAERGFRRGYESIITQTQCNR